MDVGGGGGRGGGGGEGWRLAARAALRMLLLAAVAMLLCYFTCRLAAAWPLGGPSGGFSKLGAQGEDMYRAHLVRSLKEIREKKSTENGG